MEAATEQVSSGASRREAILAATIRLLGQHGPAGVTHRAVASEADVPLAATTYYFASKDELMAEALRRLAAEEVQRLEAARDALGDLAPAAVAQAIAGVLGAQFGAGRDALAKFEVYLQGARGDELQADARATIAAFRGLAEDLLTGWGVADAKAAAAVLVGGIDGLLLHAIVEDHRVDAGVLAERIERLLLALHG